MQLRSRKHYKAALSVAREVAHKLIKDYGAGRVFLIGSLARGVDFLYGSDIDLIVEDTRDFQFLTAVADFYIYKGFKVDIKTLSWDKISSSKKIQTEGKLICENGQV